MAPKFEWDSRNGYLFFYYPFGLDFYDEEHFEGDGKMIKKYKTVIEADLDLPVFLREKEARYGTPVSYLPNPVWKGFGIKKFRTIEEANEHRESSFREIIFRTFKNSKKVQ